MVSSRQCTSLCRAPSDNNGKFQQQDVGETLRLEVDEGKQVSRRCIALHLDSSTYQVTRLTLLFHLLFHLLAYLLCRSLLVRTGSSREHELLENNRRKCYSQEINIWLLDVH